MDGLPPTATGPLNGGHAIYRTSAASRTEEEIKKAIPSPNSIQVRRILSAKPRRQRREGRRPLLELIGHNTPSATASLQTFEQGEDLGGAHEPLTG